MQYVTQPLRTVGFSCRGCTRRAATISVPTGNASPGSAKSAYKVGQSGALVGRCPPGPRIKGSFGREGTCGRSPAHPLAGDGPCGRSFGRSGNWWQQRFRGNNDRERHHVVANGGKRPPYVSRTVHTRHSRSPCLVNSAPPATVTRVRVGSRTSLWESWAGRVTEPDTAVGRAALSE